ncbi:MAG: rhodanese-like domain-containing protein [Anaerolineae bacterium]|nr:rhodanese-like domain-containing protein [Anaerolineae bacterium]MBT7070105.1 rhodanese-like domain-containing protein [Anaerolineae bacterium]MBT7325789.1 rhodanese-like domain-containing protein [Anaerolineae bacterium]
MAYEKFEEGTYMLDVRTPEEWVEYHVDGATLIPLDELEARVSEVPTGVEVIVICNSGNRSQVGRDILLNAGYSSVTSIAGGIQGWMSAGHDFVTDE